MFSNFVQRRRLYYLISAAVIVPGLIAVLTIRPGHREASLAIRKESAP